MAKNIQDATFDFISDYFAKLVATSLKQVQGSKLTDAMNRFQTYLCEPDLKDLASILNKDPRSTRFEGEVTDFFKRVSREATDHPSHLKNLWKFGLSTTEPILGYEIPNDPSEEQRDFLYSLEMSFKYAVGGVHLWASRNLAPRGYILGIRGDGSVIPKIFEANPPNPENTMKQVNNWAFFAEQAPFIMRLDPDSLDSLVHDNETWFNKPRVFPDYHFGNFLGRRLFRFGSENKVYASPHPHKIVLDTKFFDSITVKDRFRDGIIFKVKSPDKGISVGFMNLTSEREVPESCVGNWGQETFRTCFQYSLNTTYSHVLKKNLLYWKEGVLCATVGAIARDMFVCEERTKLYHESSRTPMATRSNPRPTTTVIWLPRQKIRYIGMRPTLGERDLGDSIQDVAPNEVPGHPRRCANPNPKQLELARFYGMEVPDGHTFVTPYHRNSHTRAAPVYKSRSALQVLFGMREDASQ